MTPKRIEHEVKAFNEWFEQDRRDHWESLYPGEPFKADWGLGYKRHKLEAWLARAELQ
jgi:hypothetical protein